MKKIIFAIGIFLIISTVLSPDAIEASDKNYTSHRICLRCNRDSRCGIFPILQAGMLAKVSKSETDISRQMVIGDAGLMYRVNGNSAIGLSFSWFMIPDIDDDRFALRARYRKWLKKDLSVDFSVGALTQGDDPFGNTDHGLMTSISLNMNDLFSFELMYQRYKSTAYRYDNTSHNFYYDRKQNSELYFGMSGHSYIVPLTLPLSALIVYMSESSL